MACLQFNAPFTTVALTATTAKSVIGVQAATNQAIKLLEYKVSFDGATSSNAPAVCMLRRSTFATNAPGTNSTQIAAPFKLDPGRAETVQTTAAYGWTTEPTVLTTIDATDVGQFNGIYQYILPFAAPIIVVGGQGIVVQINSPNNCNCSGKMTCEEG